MLPAGHRAQYRFYQVRAISHWQIYELILKIQREERLELFVSSAYEGITSFVHREEAILADIMRRITSCFFNCMAVIWSGEKEKPEHARESYAKLNS